MDQTIRHSESMPLCISISISHHQQRLAMRNSSLIIHSIIRFLIPLLPLFLQHRPPLLRTPPPRLLVPLVPVPLYIPQRRLHLMHDLRVAGVLPDVVADLDGGRAVGGGELDDDVEGDGFGVGGGVGEIICHTRISLVLRSREGGWGGV